MNYELIKQLDDAGFPHKHAPDRMIRVEIGGKVFNPDDDSTFRWVTIPTLSELIAACGDGLNIIYHSGNDWIAGERDPYATDDLYFYTSVKGSTPEEAVARLWLSLQK